MVDHSCCGRRLQDHDGHGVGDDVVQLACDPKSFLGHRLGRPSTRSGRLLVDDAFDPGLPPAEPFPLPVHTGDIRVDLQCALAPLAPLWGFGPLLDIDDDEARDNLARASVVAMSFVAQAAYGQGRPMVPQSEVDKGRTLTERFMIRWRGEPDPRHVEAIDAYSSPRPSTA